MADLQSVIKFAFLAFGLMIALDVSLYYLIPMGTELRMDYEAVCPADSIGCALTSHVDRYEQGVYPEAWHKISSETHTEACTKFPLFHVALHEYLHTLGYGEDVCWTQSITQIFTYFGISIGFVWRVV